MPSVTGGGASNISGSQIVDGTISDADIAANAGINITKIGSLIGDPGSLISISDSTSGTVAMTVDGNTRVLVLGMGTIQTDGSTFAPELAFNGVVKATQSIRPSSSAVITQFALFYTEVPAAGTHDITLTHPTWSVLGPHIFIVKLRVA